MACQYERRSLWGNEHEREGHSSSYARVMQTLELPDFELPVYSVGSVLQYFKVKLLGKEQRMGEEMLFHHLSPLGSFILCLVCNSGCAIK